MITEDKATEIFCMVDDFCKFFDAMTAKIYAKTYRKKEISSKFYNVKRAEVYADNDSFPRFWLSLLQTFLS